MKVNLTNDLRSLTALRFFAAFWVFLFHLRSRVDYEDNWLWAIVENGARGVDFFFILSGFVIFHVYEPQIASKQFSLNSYLIKRFARIYPLHIVMLVIFVVLKFLRGDEVNGVLPSIALLHSWNVTDGLVLNGPSWTLSAEIFAYLLFGVLVFRSPPTWIIFILLLLVSLGVHAIAVDVGKTAFVHLTWDYGALRILPLFLLGMLLRRLTPYVPFGVALIVGLAGVISFVWIAGLDAVGYEVLLPFIFLIVAGARLSDWDSLPTNGKLGVYLGEISYSIYMVHIIIIAVWFNFLPKLGVDFLPWQLVCLLVVLCSSVSYHLVEVPARRWINRYA